jgi:hypothetical protein
MTATAQPDLISGDGPAARIVRLQDGRLVALRIARSEDVSAVQQFVRGLSDRSLALLARLDCELVTDRDPHVIRVVKRLDAHELAA